MRYALGQDYSQGPLETCDPSIDPSGLCPATCSWLTETYDFFTDTSAWQACQTAKGQAALQAVADNAAHYYGANSQTAKVAQQAADQQKAQVAADVANIADYYKAGTVCYPWQACYWQGMQATGIPSWVWIAAAAVGGLMVLNMVRR